jgi:hypothetical protein
MRERRFLQIWPCASWLLDEVKSSFAGRAKNNLALCQTWLSHWMMPIVWKLLAGSVDMRTKACKPASLRQCYRTPCINRTCTRQPVMQRLPKSGLYQSWARFTTLLSCATTLETNRQTLQFSLG